MEYSKYEKAFIMLEEQGGDFAAKSAVPMKGYVKVETGNGKGAIRINVQNLKFFESGSYIYKLILFGKRREKTIYATIGTITVNKMGNGETYFRFNPEDLDGNGHELAEFSYVIVAALAMKNDREALHPVLMGALEIPFATDNAGRRQEEVKAASTFETKEPEETGIGIGTGAETGTGARTGLGSRGEEPENKNYNGFYNTYLIEQCRELWEKAMDYDGILPFKEDRTKAVWKKISDPGDLPMVAPGAHYLAAKYKHYIFGENKDRYYLGIPGRFLREEQPDNGLSGFVFWQPIVGAEKLGPFEMAGPSEKYKSAYGYWIAAVSKETGDILEA